MIVSLALGRERALGTTIRDPEGLAEGSISTCPKQGANPSRPRGSQTSLLDPSTLEPRGFRMGVPGS